MREMRVTESLTPALFSRRGDGAVSEMIGCAL